MTDTKREKKKQRSFEADCDKVDKKEFKPSLKRKKVASNNEEIIDKKV